jgi:ferric-dicitrate binding protein FerR (iron transport regulator)
MTARDDNRLEAYLEGTLSPEEARAVEERLRVDPQCRLALLLEAGLTSRLRDVLRAEAEPSVTRIRTAPRLAVLPAAGARRYWVPAAAAAAFLALAGAFLWLRPDRAAHPDGGAARAGAVARTPVPPVAPAAPISTPVPAPEPTVASAGVPPGTPGPATTQPEDFVAPPAAVLPDGAVAVQDPPAAVENIVAAAAADGRGPDVPPVRMPGGNLVVSAGRRVPDGSGLRIAAGTRPPDGTVLAAAGAVTLRDGVEGQKTNVLRWVRPGDGFHLGESFWTGPGSAASLRYADGSVLRLRGNTRLQLARTGGNRAVHLADGAVSLQLQPCGPHSHFSVRTPYLDARVESRLRFTAFQVLADGDTSWIGVQTGVVEAVQIALPPGAAARSASDGPAAMPVVRLHAGECAAVAAGYPFGRMSTANPAWRGRATGSRTYP